MGEPLPCKAMVGRADRSVTNCLKDAPLLSPGQPLTPIPTCSPLLSLQMSLALLRHTNAAAYTLLAVMTLLPGGALSMELDELWDVTDVGMSAVIAEVCKRWEEFAAVGLGRDWGRRGGAAMGVGALSMELDELWDVTDVGMSTVIAKVRIGACPPSCNTALLPTPHACVPYLLPRSGIILPPSSSPQVCMVRDTKWGCPCPPPVLFSVHPHPFPPPRRAWFATQKATASARALSPTPRTRTKKTPFLTGRD